MIAGSLAIMVNWQCVPEGKFWREVYPRHGIQSLVMAGTHAHDPSRWNDLKVLIPVALALAYAHHEFGPLVNKAARHHFYQASVRRVPLEGTIDCNRVGIAYLEMHDDLTEVVQWLRQLCQTGLSLLEAFEAEAMD